MIPELMQAFNIDITYIGILSSSFFYTYIVMQIPSGLLIDIYGPRRIIVYGTLICTLSIFWFAYSTHFYEVLISRMVIGFALSPMVIITFCLITRWFNPLFFPLMILHRIIDCLFRCSENVF